MKSIYKTVIFDLDGTIFDDYGTIADALNYALKKSGYPTESLARVRRAVGRGPGTLFRVFVPEKDADAVERLYMERYSKIICSKVHLLPGAYRLLKDLSGDGVQLAVASNKSGKFTRHILKHLKVDTFFRKIICGDEIEMAKPHPQILLSIMRELKSQANKTLYVGDMDIDARTGRGAGVKTVVVLTGSSSRNEVEKEKPYRILKRISDVRRLVYGTLH
ncbi:MAG: HAD family hydrolase [Candidatus Omnitrophica bacterium]|nr:HAD family hydrolase [Candidatus Omnitrophota bacterium]